MCERERETSDDYEISVVSQRSIRDHMGFLLFSLELGAFDIISHSNQSDHNLIECLFFEDKCQALGQLCYDPCSSPPCTCTNAPRYTVYMGICVCVRCTVEPHCLYTFGASLDVSRNFSLPHGSNETFGLVSKLLWGRL